MLYHWLARQPRVVTAVPTTWRYAYVTWVAVSLLLLQVFVFRGDPVTTDENAYLFQARVFAEGRLWAPPPPEGDLL